MDVAFADFVVPLCQEAGRVMLERRRHNLSITNKSEVDLVTEVDLALEEMISEAITARFTEHAVVGEHLKLNGSLALVVYLPPDADQRRNSIIEASRA